MLSWPSHRAMTVLSIPAASRRMAAVCRRLRTVTFLPFRLGQDLAAVVVGGGTRADTASWVSRLQVRVGNMNPSLVVGFGANARRTFPLWRSSGVARSLRPFPWHRTGLLLAITS